MKSLFRIVLVIMLMTLIVTPTHPSVFHYEFTTNDLTGEITDEQFLAKISEDMARGKTCAQMSNESPNQTRAVEAQIEEVETPKADVRGKVVTVSSLVQKALEDQRRLLTTRQNELERWNRNDQAHFARWFGTTSEQARELIYERIRVLTLLNNEYSVGNFRKAVPSKPGIYAFVHPNDPSRIFVDRNFILGSFLGENSRAGTLCHEMSHFTLAGGTKDIVYGANNCKRLAQLKTADALSNADSFEFYVEGIR